MEFDAPNQLGRLITAMVTPFRDDLSVDLDKAQLLARHLVECGSEGLVVAGTTGEVSTLSQIEKLDLFRAVKEAVGGQAAVIANTGTNNTAASVDLTVRTEELGVDGIMAVVPYYNKPCQEGIFRHFKAIAQATSLPVMLYNVPARTGSNLAVDTLARLAELPNVVAVKEASGNFDQATEIARRLPPLALYSGDDGLTLPMMSIGATGVVSVAAHVAGPAIRELIDSYLRGHRTRAMELHLALAELIRALFITTNPVPVKEALSLVGLNVGRVRPPLSPLSEAERAEVSRCLRQAQPFLLELPAASGQPARL